MRVVPSGFKGTRRSRRLRPPATLLGADSAIGADVSPVGESLSRNSVSLPCGTIADVAVGLVVCDATPEGIRAVSLSPECPFILRRWTSVFAMAAESDVDIECCAAGVLDEVDGADIGTLGSVP